MKKWGFRDTPIENSNDECLGLGEYAGALSDFIVQCEMPMTIAIQGDWGSGKTSMIHMITHQLPTTAPWVYINTWQFAQFDRQADIAISVLSEFIDGLGGSNNEAGSTAKKILSVFSKHAGKVAAVVDAIGAPGSGVVEGLGKMAQNALGEGNDTQKIKELKSKIKALVDAKLETKSVDRVVVFIDDLDRLAPEKAVEVLEAIKLFLDFSGCVFVLAIDYQVVVKGVAQKYGGSVDAQKGKDFFDKMIQLPFNMPVGQYDVQQYIKNLLDGIDSKVPDSEIQQYQDLIEASIGYNPRGMKRIFNTLLLLRLVTRRKNKEVEDAAWQRILFAFLCLQVSFEPIYRYLSSQQNLAEEHITQFFSNATAVSDVSGATHEVFDELKALGPLIVSRASRFMKVFFDSLQLESEGDMKSLSIQELEMIRSVLSLTALTTAETKKEMDWTCRHQNRAFIERVNQRMAARCSEILPLFNKPGFRIYQSNTEEYANSYIVFDAAPACQLGINLQWDGKEAKFFIGSWTKTAQKQGVAWLASVAGLSKIEGFFTGKTQMPEWGPFAFVNCNGKEKEDAACEVYFKITSLIADQLMAQQR